MVESDISSKGKYTGIDDGERGRERECGVKIQRSS